MKHDWFIRLIVAVGCIGGMVQAYQTLTREAYAPVEPWWGLFGLLIAACLYGVVWAIVPEKWWKD